MTIEQTGILLSLLLTIVGWGITAYYRRRILDRQIAAEREKEARQLIIPRKMEQLDAIKEWLEAGYRLWRLRESLPYDADNISKKELENRRQEIDKQIHEWGAHYWSMVALAGVLDPRDAESEQPEGRKDLGFMLSGIYHNMPTVNLAYDDDPKFSEHTRGIFMGFFPQAILRVDQVIEQTIKKGHFKE
jgi:hypothetical protein